MYFWVLRSSSQVSLKIFCYMWVSFRNHLKYVYALIDGAIVMKKVFAIMCAPTGNIDDYLSFHLPAWVKFESHRWWRSALTLSEYMDCLRTETSTFPILYTAISIAPLISPTNTGKCYAIIFFTLCGRTLPSPLIQHCSVIKRKMCEFCKRKSNI